jgi:glycosyltransferase involved in cell wall biosynthesis
VKSAERYSVEPLSEELGRPLRVAHLEMGKHLYGGAQQVLYLLNALPNAAVESILICPQGAAVGDAARESGITVREIAYSGELDWRSVGRIGRILQTDAIDLVHVHSRRGADIWGGLAAHRARLPCIVSRRVDNPELSWIGALKYRFFVHVIAISEGIGEVLLAGGIPAEKISCVRSAVDWARFQQDADAEGLRQRFGLPKKAVVAGMAAQLIPRKGHDVLLDAMSALSSDWPDFHVLVMGKGPLAQSLQRDIDVRGLASHVHCVGFLEDLEWVMPSLDFLMHPARTEGLGVVLLQAASAGLAVIASNAGGMPEAVAHETTGLLIPPGDPTALTNAITRMLNNPTERAAFGKAGRGRMAREFSIEAMASGNLHIYQKVMLASRM